MQTRTKEMVGDKHKRVIFSLKVNKNTSKAIKNEFNLLTKNFCLSHTKQAYPNTPHNIVMQKKIESPARHLIENVQEELNNRFHDLEQSLQKDMSNYIQALEERFQNDLGNRTQAVQERLQKEIKDHALALEKRVDYVENFVEKQEEKEREIQRRQYMKL